jgi:putative transposase
MGMSRPLRIEFENALYHITTRGNRREPIFVDSTDRCALLHTIGEGMERFDATVFAYCLMANHYHLVLRTRRANLSQVMRYVNGNYAQTYNRRHSKIGHLFQGRFNAILVQDDAYCLQACRYVDLNPVRAGIVRVPQEWPWSSYRAHAGQAPGPRWLDTLAPQASREDRVGAYVRFVSEGHGVRLWDDALRSQIYLGDESFAQAMRGRRADVRNDPEIPLVQRQSAQRPLQHYLDDADRNAAIARAHLEGRHTQVAISRATGSSRSRISRLIARYRATSKT